MLPRLALTALLTLAPAASSTPERETVTFRLHKFQQEIGIERSTLVHEPDGSLEVRTVFSFTDRTRPVPLGATLTLEPGGSPKRFAMWGSTSRFSTVDDTVDVAAGKITIDQSGAIRQVTTPPAFFVGSYYSPVIVTELMWRYWNAQGRPRSLPLFPAGAAVIERRGTDDVTNDAGKAVTLERYALTGRSWGRETFWVDAGGKLAAYKGVDSEFDHFEAIRREYSEALPALVASAAADGVAALRETSRAGASRGENRDDAAPVAYVGATLIDASGSPALPDSVVLVDNGRIAAVGPRSRVKIPKTARRVDVKGKTLVPGLWDMHAHFEQVEWGPIYLAAGVTTVRDCGNELDFIRSVRDTIDAGKGLGPRILLACIVDGEGPGTIGTVRLREEKDIPDLIKKFQGAGCAQVKIYSSFDPRLIGPLSRAAHEAGLSVTGHVPRGIGAVHAVEAGMDQINHLSFVVRALLPGVDPDARLERPAYLRALEKLDTGSEAAKTAMAILAKRGVVVDPTIALDELGFKTHAAVVPLEPGLAKVAPPLKEALDTMGAAPEDAADTAKRWKADLATLKALHEAGVPIVAGTDQSVPGHSLHREMELYVEAGFTPMEAIQSATIVPARAMHRDKELGTIEPGKLADFIVIDGDPLADIKKLRNVVTVVQGGKAYDPAPLWRMVGFTP